jgi:hypothetical protein
MVACKLQIYSQLSIRRLRDRFKFAQSSQITSFNAGDGNSSNKVVQGYLGTENAPEMVSFTLAGIPGAANFPSPLLNE